MTCSVQHVPVVLDSMLTCIEQQKQTEGLYRLPGRSDAVTQLKEDMEKVL